MPTLLFAWFVGTAIGTMIGLTLLWVTINLIEREWF